MKLPSSSLIKLLLLVNLTLYAFKNNLDLEDIDFLFKLKNLKCLCVNEF